MIDDYLADLLAQLRLPTRRRRRIVAEVEDHLSCAAAELHAEGLPPDQAEHEAVRRFGPARELARTFLEQEAARGGMHAAQAGTAFALVCGAILMLAPGRALFDTEFPASVVAFVLGQVAFVAGGLTLVRAWRSRRAGGPRGARLELILRGTFVVLACALAGVLDAAARAVSSGAGWGADAWTPFAVLVVGAALTGTTVARARRRANAVPPSADPSEEDIEWIPRPLARRIPWLDLRAHPWRFALTVSLAAGIALAGGHGLTDGGLSLHHLGRQLLGGGLLLGTEALASLLGFVALGRYLGLRSGTAASSPEPLSTAAR